MDVTASPLTHPAEIPLHGMRALTLPPDSLRDASRILPSSSTETLQGNFISLHFLIINNPLILSLPALFSLPAPAPTKRGCYKRSRRSHNSLPRQSWCPSLHSHPQTQRPCVTAPRQMLLAQCCDTSKRAGGQKLFV